MKKLISMTLVLALALMLALTGCGKGGTDTPQTDGKPTTIDAQLQQQFDMAMTENPDISCEELAQYLLENTTLLDIEGTVMPVEPGYLNGFTEEIDGFSEGAFFGPMIGSIPFVGYTFRVEDGTDVDAFTVKLSELSDLRWNICTEADVKVIESHDNMVLFAMTPQNFED